MENINASNNFRTFSDNKTAKFSGKYGGKNPVENMFLQTKGHKKLNIFILFFSDLFMHD